MSRASLLSVLPLLLLAACAAESGAGEEQTGEDDVTGGKVLLDCNVFESGGGPDQQVVVVRRTTGLVLRELTNSGSWEERKLPTAEWDKKHFTLRKDRFDGPTAKNRLWKDGDQWFNEASSPGWRTFGMAYCEEKGK